MNAKAKKPVKKQGSETLVERVRTHIRDGILDGQYRPGDRLREVEIAKSLGVSRTPIREAVKALEWEGLISVEPWRGVVVSRLSRVQSCELFEFLETLEGFAAYLAAQNVTDEQLRRLDQILKKFETSAPDDVNLQMRMNMEFHAGVYEASNNRFLMQSIESLRTSLALLPMTALIYQERQKAVIKEHREIFKALAARNPELARKVATSHVRNSGMVRLINIVSPPDSIKTPS